MTHTGIQLTARLQRGFDGLEDHRFRHALLSRDRIDLTAIGRLSIVTPEGEQLWSGSTGPRSTASWT